MCIRDRFTTPNSVPFGSDTYNPSVLGTPPAVILNPVNEGVFASIPPAAPAFTPPIPADIGGGNGGRKGADGVGDDIPVTSKVTSFSGLDPPRREPGIVIVSPT